MMFKPFLDEVARFRADLDRVSGWDDLRALWRRNIPPYRMANHEPLSPEYKAEMLDLYEKMTETTYKLSNEMTSTKVPPADFTRGYPWMTNDLGTAAAELAKVVQAFRVMQRFAPKAQRLVEFGSGWANLAASLARIGRDVTAVDIDAGFIARTDALAQRQELPIHTVNADFLTAARAADHDFDAAIFQSSFHHCLDFNELLDVLPQALTPDARIFFFSEPIFRSYPVPWGLRTDGESIWAITANKWCELGFDQDFFIGLLHSHGFLGTATGAIADVIGDAWVATPAETGLPLEEWTLPARYDETFHPPRDAGHGRFLREHSILPVPRRRRAVLTLANHAPIPLSAGIVSGAAQERVTLDPGEEIELVLEGVRDEIALRSDSFVPDEVYGSGDLRRVGLALRRARFS